MYEVKWDWRQRIAWMFESIASRDATGLVIDLRENEGGNDCGNEIIARLIDQDLPLFQDYDRLVRFRSTPEDLNPYLDTWDRSFEHLGEGAEDVGRGFYRLQADDDTVRRIAPEGPRFKGKVIVLSSAQNSSATFGFIQLIRQAGLARIYGQPTGGNQRGINGGSFFFVRLPETGLEADLPLVGTFPRQPKPDAGLDPDVRIDRQPEDIAAGRDPVLERALLDLA
jgi:C-terminal processing protease CtpA/Prc